MVSKVSVCSEASVVSDGLSGSGESGGFGLLEAVDLPLSSLSYPCVLRIYWLSEPSGINENIFPLLYISHARLA